MKHVRPSKDERLRSGPGQQPARRCSRFFGYARAREHPCDLFLAGLGAQHVDRGDGFAAARQLKVSKAEAGGETVTSIDMLGAKARKEEIARMLAGASVTKEARAAAGRLLAGA